MKALIFALLYSVMGIVQAANIVQIPQNLSDEQGARFVHAVFDQGRYVLDSGTFIFESDEKSAQYPNGDFALLWALGEGASDENMTKDEYTRVWTIMKYLSKKNFRVVMNVAASSDDIKETVETDTTSVVLVSTHGNTSGFYDYNKQRVPYDVFQNKSKSMYQFILAACYGTESRANYLIPDDMVMYTWSGLTNTSDLMKFLLSDSWTGMEGKDRAVRN
jgi:hypothetical protein